MYIYELNKTAPKYQLLFGGGISVFRGHTVFDQFEGKI